MRLGDSVTIFSCAVAVLVTGGCAERGADDPLASLPRWPAGLDLRIGSVDDPEQALTFIRAMETSPDGRIFTLHPQEQVVRIFDPAGEPLGVIGGRGDGPTELQNAIELGWVADTLWVLDARGYIFKQFDAEGDHLGSFSVPFRAGDDPRSPQPPRARGLLFDGTLHGAPPAFSRQIADGTLTHDILLLMARDGQVIDTVASIPFGGNEWAIADPDDPRRPQSFSEQPFADGLIWSYSPTERALVVVERPAASSAEAAFRVSKLSLEGDTVFSRAYQAPALPVTQEEVDSILDAQGRFLEDSPIFNVTAARGRELAEQSLYRPQFKPLITGLVLGKDGSVWLRRQATSGAGISWLVIDSEGEPTGQVDLPTSVQVQVVDPPYIYGWETDELDVPYVVRYRIAAG